MGSMCAMTANSFQGRRNRTGEIVALLRDPANFPERPTTVDVRETHMAWVFLTDSYAYKLKKAVRFSYLDYSTGAKRRAACEAELRLNSRLSPWVYLGLVPVLADAANHLRLDGAEGAPVEWLVKMRRLPAADFLENAIANGRSTAQDLTPAAELLAEFFAAQPCEPQLPGDYTDDLRNTIRDDADAIAATGHTRQAARARDLARHLETYLNSRAELFADRAKRRIDGHGDLRPEHVALGPPPAVIDCIEFSRAFRLNDPVEELAFLHMEATYLGDSTVGAVFLAPYRRVSGDAPSPELIAFYAAKRALLRAKLALWHIYGDIPDPERYVARADAYLDVAERFVSELQ